MTDLKQLNDALYRYVRPLTHPLAIRMCTSLAEIPKEAQFPKRDLGLVMPVCQAFSLAHRHGRVMAVGLEDQQCPLGNLVLGFLKPKKAFLDGSFQWSLLPPGEPSARYAQSLKMLEYGRYSHILIAPIQKSTFEPHLLLIYGNPGQVVRMVQARLYLQGGVLPSYAGLGATCSLIVGQTILADECQYVLQGSGPRRFTHAQDHEMAFTIPVSKVEQMVEGLEESESKSTYTYPPPAWFTYQVEFTPGYQKLQEFLMKEDE